ncbi:MAG: tRNA adenosine(34) deaminase TadA [Isosphaeraceae bacterium]
MRQALTLARAAVELGEVPIGAVVTRNGRIIAQAHNLRETTNDPTAHAERLALTLAGRVLGDWRLEGCSLYVTLEPCAMCAGAAVLSRIDRLVYGAIDPKAGACQSLYRLTDDRRANHRVAIVSGVLHAECSAILKEFFEGKRDRRQPARPDQAGHPSEGCLSG